MKSLKHVLRIFPLILFMAFFVSCKSQPTPEPMIKIVSGSNEIKPIYYGDMYNKKEDDIERRLKDFMVGKRFSDMSYVSFGDEILIETSNFQIDELEIYDYIMDTNANIVSDFEGTQADTFSVNNGKAKYIFTKKEGLEGFSGYYEDEEDKLIHCILIRCTINKRSFAFATIILSDSKKLEKITGGELLTPQQQSEFAIYGSSDIKATIYKPVPIDEAKNYLGNIFDNINSNIVNNLPFKVGESESYIVDVNIDNEKEIKKQVHFVYLPDKNPLGNYGEEFAVISVYEMDEATINNIFELFKKEDKDTFGNHREILQKDDLTLISTRITTNSAFTYSYYQYNEAERQMVSSTNVANEIITHKDGLLYEVGYHLSNSTKEKEDKVLYALINFIEAKQVLKVG